MCVCGCVRTYGFETASLTLTQQVITFMSSGIWRPVDWWLRTFRSIVVPTFPFYNIPRWVNRLTQKIKVRWSSETSAAPYQSTQRNIPECLHLQCDLCAKLPVQLQCGPWGRASQGSERSKGQGWGKQGRSIVVQECLRVWIAHIFKVWNVKVMTFISFKLWA